MQGTNRSERTSPASAPSLATATPQSTPAASAKASPPPSARDPELGKPTAYSIDAPGRALGTRKRRRTAAVHLLLGIAACGCAAPRTGTSAYHPTATPEQIANGTAPASPRFTDPTRRIDGTELMTELRLQVAARDAERDQWLLKSPQGHRVELFGGMSTVLVDGQPVDIGATVRTHGRGHVDLPATAVPILRDYLSQVPATPPPAPPPAAPLPAFEPRESKTAPRVAPSSTVPLPNGWAVKPDRKWDSIVIHHSATQSGSAASFHRDHRRRGWSRGLGYHFVIGNGTGAGDGQIEIGPRWKKQQDGAHAGAGAQRYNRLGIGICLVGNFQEGRPTKKQMAALETLCRALMSHYGIAKSRVLTHKSVRPKPTKCPGHLFPWKEFIASLEPRS